ncbi:MAG TPA: amidase family protein, partial [Phenylobacterium sp.]|nr:amidase family protein [Phenylobacterium sp.]
LAALRAAGAELVDLPNPEFKGLGDAENLILGYEFKAGINAYLAAAPPAVRARTLDDLIAFNASEPRETVLFGQELFQLVATLGGLDDPAYLKAKADARRIAGAGGIDRWVAEHRLDAIVAPTNAPAPLTDPVNDSAWLGSASRPAAVAGYPHLTVPMGAVRGLPVGLSFIGPAWSEAKLLSLGYAFEQATRARVVPTFRPGIEADEDLQAAYAPLP